MNEMERTKEVTKAMRKASISEMIIYAWEKTGRIATETNWHLLTEEDKKEWNDACDEYIKEHLK